MGISISAWLRLAPPDSLVKRRGVRNGSRGFQQDALCVPGPQPSEDPWAQLRQGLGRGDFLPDRGSGVAMVLVQNIRLADETQVPHFGNLPLLNKFDVLGLTQR